MNYSNEQKKAISHIFKPALVLAGPGSGKTRVIVQRLINLLKQYPYAKVLSLTFSKAAASEMEQRFKILAKKEYSSVHFSTIHSLCYTILRRGWPTEPLPGLVTSQKMQIIKKIFHQVNNENISDTEAEMLISAISRSRNNSQQNFDIGGVQIKNFNKICKNYAEYKKKRNLIDYDDMIFYAKNMLISNSQQCSYWANHYDFIQVDEAQDLTGTQFDIISKLSPNRNIFVVADDDQSIYGFRGADPACLTDFQKKFPDCIKYYLNDNYRCSAEIVNFSSNIIAQNSNRFIKEPVAKNENPGKIEILHTTDSCCQGKYILLTISESKLSGTFGILYRNNRSALSVAAVLIYNNLSFHISGGTYIFSREYVNLFIIECIKEQVQHEKPSAIFKRLVDCGFRKKCISKRKMTDPDIENVDTVLDFLHTVCNLCSTFDQVRQLIQSVSDTCICGEYKGDILPEKEIFLSTIHSSKGLEYDAVFVIDIIKDEFPGKSSTSGKLLEEERRLFYVAITRAKVELYLLYSKNYGLLSREESIFIRESISTLKGGC